jgi:DNA-binding NarL/FixJ family response regulator
LVADEHEVIRAGLKSLFHDTDIKLIAEAASGEAAVRLILKHKPDVVLLDVRMPDGDGLNALGRIKLERPGQAVLMFSAFDNPTYIARALALGASGYLSKGISRSKLLDSIRRASKGEAVWAREELRRLTGASSSMRAVSDVDVPLTKRETQVLQHLAKGQTNKQIADSLDISYETVKEHVQHVLRKIGVTDRTQAAVWAVRNRLM